jgi:2-polyprenyl-3-methyl-5-hydroxy-6-metoxy-1,4-benzoquinol methylase
MLVHEVVSELKGVGRVCDLGCGNGAFDLAIASHVGQVVDVDRSSSGISIAAQSAGALSNVKFIDASIDEALPARLLLEGSHFDAVISLDVIEHLYRPSVLIDVAWQILRPNGCLIVCTPYHGYLKNLAISLVDGWDAHHGVAWDGGHIKFFSVKTLSAMVAARGFTAIKFRYFGRAPYLWKNMICIARRGA